MTIVEESIQVITVKSHFTKSYNTIQKVKNYGSHKLWFSLVK